jgi:translation initiation factor 3 subunit G
MNCLELPPMTESEPDENGYITRIEYKINEKNQKVRITSKIRRYKREMRINDSVKQRYENWTKFGLAASDNNNVTFVSDEDIFMEPPPSKTTKEIKNDNDMFADMYKDIFSNAQLHDNIEEEEKIDDNKTKQICKICNGNHWTRVCSSLKEKENTQKLDENLIKKDTTIQITNLSKNINEYDLYDLFSQVGEIRRILIPKDYDTQQSRGFGFVLFNSSKDADNALKRFSNYGFDHLILKLNIVNPK